MFMKMLFFHEIMICIHVKRFMSRGMTRVIYKHDLQVRLKPVHSIGNNPCICEVTYINSLRPSDAYMRQ